MEHCVVSGYLSDLPMISIIVPAYNIEQYLPRCLDSLVNQTYKNLEILLVDDGSVDLSGIICNKYAADDSRIRVFHIKNGGVSNARNFALDNMHGEYVTFVDGDDWLDLDWVEKAFIELKNSDVLVYIGGHVKNYPDSSEKVTHKYMPRSILMRDECLKEMYMKPVSENAFIWEVWGKLFHSSLWENVRFNTNISMGEDALAFWNILKLVDKVLFVPSYNYHYFYRETSAVNKLKCKYVFDIFSVNKIIWQDSRHIMDCELIYALKSRFFCSRVRCLLNLTCFECYEDELSVEKKFFYKDICQHFGCITKLHGIRGILKVLLASLPTCFLRPLSRIIAKKNGIDIDE